VNANEVDKRVADSTRVGRKATAAVLKKSGRYFLLDGHHTAIAAKLAGREMIKARFYDAD
jgi:hypothetical protein